LRRSGPLIKLKALPWVPHRKSAAVSHDSNFDGNSENRTRRNRTATKFSGNSSIAFRPPNHPPPYFDATAWPHLHGKPFAQGRMKDVDMKRIDKATFAGYFERNYTIPAAGILSLQESPCIERVFVDSLQQVMMN
jgi:hypothetical protein